MPSRTRNRRRSRQIGQPDAQFSTIPSLFPQWSGKELDKAFGKGLDKQFQQDLDKGLGEDFNSGLSKGFRNGLDEGLTNGLGEDLSSGLTFSSRVLSESLSNCLLSFFSTEHWPVWSAVRYLVRALCSSLLRTGPVRDLLTSLLTGL
jgi:hypothetical protein